MIQHIHNHASPGFFNGLERLIRTTNLLCFMFQISEKYTFPASFQLTKQWLHNYTKCPLCGWDIESHMFCASSNLQGWPPTVPPQSTVLLSHLLCGPLAMIRASGFSQPRNDPIPFMFESHSITPHPTLTRSNNSVLLPSPHLFPGRPLLIIDVLLPLRRHLPRRRRHHWTEFY